MVCGPASSFVAGGSAAMTNDGGSLTGLTVIVNVCAEVLLFGGVLEPSSESVTLIVATPYASGAAVNVSVPSGLTTGESVKVSVASLEVTLTWNCTVCPDSSGGPAEMFVAH